MARRSDFAQKLLDDLRLRKERLATAQSSRNAARGDGYTNSRPMGRSSTNGKGSMKNLPLQNRPAGRQKLTEPSSQIVPFTGAHGATPVGDFSLALAFAFENAGKLRMTMDSPRNQIPMLSFLREMGRGSVDVRERRSLTVQVPALSQLHVKEISKGAEKLNQILRAWSSGLNFDQCSVEIGKELLKGATDLQESLRMLANLQGGSVEFSTGPRQKNRIVLLEDREDDDVSIVESTGSNKIKRIEPPKFSFDKPARRDQGVQQAVVAVRNMGLPAPTNPNESLRFSSSMQSNHVKGRKANVIAKLMGLEELPANDGVGSSFHDGTAGDASSKPNSPPPRPMPPSIQFDQPNKSPLSQEISRMMMGADRKIPAPVTRVTEAESVEIPYLKKLEKTNSAQNDLKMDDGRLKTIRSVKNQKHEQGMTRNPDRSGPKDRKRMGANETNLKPRGKQEMGQKVRGKGGNNEGKPQVDDKNGSPLHDNSPRKRSDGKHVDGNEFLSKTPESSFRVEKINNKKLLYGGNEPENRVPAEFADTTRTKLYEGMKTERVPAQRGGAQVARARESKEVPPQVLRKVKVVEHLETKKFQGMKEAARKKGGSIEGVLRLPRPWSSLSQGFQKIKRDEILVTLENIDEPMQTDVHKSTESISTIQEQAEYRTAGITDEKMRYREFSKMVPNSDSDRKDPVMSPLHIAVARSQEAPYREFSSPKLNFDQPSDGTSPYHGSLRTQTQVMLTESENQLKRVLLRSQFFIDTAETFFDFNIPRAQTTPAHQYILSKTDDSLILDCGYEITKRKGRLQELAVHPLAKMPASFIKVKTLDDLIKQLSDFFNRLKSHGRNGNPSCEPAEYVPRMFEADIEAGDPETNCMWEFGWNSRAFAFVERDEVARTIEKMVIGKLIDELARDLLVHAA
ncbi:hypothetical protein MLD38_034954 [Melastoma candidum]|uniref:Uncharacterized protein n=1 Tax=Melastoma candidum TaxID=119954 RepID=A0ACB9MDP9_9MYRT|nr:hypothetical protein MLD38_034954 [Melastoma candidum]